MEALLSNKLVKDTYSITLNSTNIFKIEEFISMLRYKNYWENSYTKYSNEIGLTSEGKYLNYNTDVVLDFPHKDSVLEGGMTKEDQGKKEIYYHNVLAKEEIDTLLSPKVLTNIKKYDKNGEHNIDDFTDKDNLIIKGNNLVALYSLKERYENKIKMIYIDPPYNTGNDTFRYNDKFNHSTWLTFMKNRLEISKELLSNDGIIVIQVDYHENSYLRVLMDELFGKENYVSEITVQTSTASGPKMAHINTRIPKLKDSLLIYKKNSININIQPYKLKDKWDAEYSKILLNFTEEDRNNLNQYRAQNNYEEAKKIIEKVTLSTISKEFPENKKNDEWLHENAWRIVADKQNTGLDNLLSKSEKFWDGDVSLSETSRENLAFFRTDKNFGADSRVEVIFADENLKEHTGDIWTDISTSGGFSSEGGVNFPTAKKPEKLLKRIIEMFTYEKDIVLDFYGGSFSTQATAMKLNRQFIGIEQMDYIKTLSVQRLINVINGDQTGISKEVNWQGGGSFVYAELASLNERYVKDIQQADSEVELEKVLSTMKGNAYLNFKVDLERVSSKDEGYHAFSLEERKEVLIQVLDMNQLYLSYSEIEDEQYKIPEDVKAFNHSFYQKEGVKNE
ncbi:site-specific DNA-methyltransferase [Streptococcus dysgalactiae]|uniref:site-specific DNA-methyltransferase n=1 Tax=Streptococcus dysgalactiae TaxID=1334 RepID=UPI00227B6284|nr:site-specific DNA-methyltransferase [Streptococcus dysgalactiae]